MSATEGERLATLEARQNAQQYLTQRLIDSQQSIDKSLQELVAIHREGSARQEADRKTLERHENEIGDIWGSHRKLHKVVWSYIWTGTGIFLTLMMLWKAGLLPLIIGAAAR